MCNGNGLSAYIDLDLFPKTALTMPLPESPVVFDRPKLKALVHYICHRAPNPRDLGTTKLNKILYYADTGAYLLLGHPITGERYIKQQYGPVSQHLLSIIEELEQERLIAVGDATGYSIYKGEYTPRRYFSRTRPDISAFTADEISIVDEVLEDICLNYTARSISDLSHDLVWQTAEIGEEIPYYTALLRYLGEVTSEDLAWARQMLADAGIGNRT
jgi:uncharacterized phage-associated protein